MNIMHRSTDHETGEVTLTKRNVQMIEIDMETGEMDSNMSTAIPMMRRTTFVVPKELYQTQRRNKKKKLRCIDSVDNYTLFKKEEVINLHEVNFNGEKHSNTEEFYFTIELSKTLFQSGTIIEFYQRWNKFLLICSRTVTQLKTLHYSYEIKLLSFPPNWVEKRTNLHLSPMNQNEFTE